MSGYIWLLFAIWVITVSCGFCIIEKILEKKKNERNVELKKENKILKLALKTSSESLSCCNCKFQETCSKTVLNNTQCYYNLLENARVEIENEEEKKDAI